MLDIIAHVASMYNVQLWEQFCNAKTCLDLLCQCLYWVKTVQAAQILELRIDQISVVFLLGLGISFSRLMKECDTMSKKAKYQGFLVEVLQIHLLELTLTLQLQQKGINCSLTEVLCRSRLKSWLYSQAFYIYGFTEQSMSHAF